MPDRSRDPPPSKRNSITDRLLGSFNQARKDTSASIQRRSSSASKQSPVPRIREWLDTCNAEHEHHCAVGSETEVTTWHPVWLIDSVEKRLVRAKPADRYLALSYVYGTPTRRSAPQAQTQLLTTSLDAFQLGLPDIDIPQTFLDAMWLSKKLGLRYLWVDRLCIVQDDEAEMENHVRHMAYVFANAYITIVAASGDAHTGLISLNPRRATRGVRPGGRDHQELILSSKWNTRGWTLVEHQYSRRSIFFFEDVVTWECHCETWPGSTTNIVKKIRGNRHDCAKVVPSEAFAYKHSPWPDLDEYARLAMDYSSRRLTFVEDSLRAFSGITHVLSRSFPGGFIYGMPLMFLDIAMLWRPHASTRRRAMAKPPFLPSWSWVGWWFDNVPADLTLWRAAADYVEEAKNGKRVDSKRYRSPHSFKIRPTISWNLTDRNNTVPVENTGLQFRDLRTRRNSTAELPPGWARSGSHYKHDSDDTTIFKYPIPVEDPPEPGNYEPPVGEQAFPGPLLSFKTTVGFFDVDYHSTLGHRDKSNPPVAVGNIWSKTNRWIGQFRAHDAWLGIQSSNYDGEEKIEFIAISQATERRGSHVFDSERFEEHMDADEIIDIVNVLWIERIGDVCFRRGIGHILLKAWDAQAKDEVGILLG
ncbi:Fc.00g110960.m01.CDS01 [Cosmosporella sp. VM-42]